MGRGKVQGTGAVEEMGHRWPQHAPTRAFEPMTGLQKAVKETKTRGNLFLSF